LKKNWKKTITYIKVAYAVLIFLFVVIVGAVICIGLIDRTVITNSVFMNSVALVLGLFSLPGVLMSFYTLMDTKKKYKATTVCPKCRHTVELHLEEI
jgi:hypothetical protein